MFSTLRPPFLFEGGLRVRFLATSRETPKVLRSETKQNLGGALAEPGCRC